MYDRYIFDLLLRTTLRKGSIELIDELDRIGFFTSPASAKYHGCYEGGLLKHSLAVYENCFALANKTGALKFVSQESITIACLLHDVCKAGLYIRGTDGSYSYNLDHPKGHALLSISRVSEFITLTDQEVQMIRFHMGYYGTSRFSEKSGEYFLGELVTAWDKHPETKLIHFADEMAALAERINEELLS